jgi:hypothetical protein
MLGDIRENYQLEITKSKAQLEATFNESKTFGSFEISRVREECSARYGNTTIFIFSIIFLSEELMRKTKK